MTYLRRPHFLPSLTSFVKSIYLFLVILGGLFPASLLNSMFVNHTLLSSTQHFPASLPNNMFVNRAVGSSTQQTGCSDSYGPAVNLADGVVLSTEVVQMPTGLEHISLLDIDVTKPDVLLNIVLAHNRLISPDETVTSMANRSNALAGINGDFYEINGPGRPIGMLMMNGKLLQSPTVYAVLGITSTQRLTFGFESFSGNVIRGTASHKLRAINHFVEINEGKLVLLTPDLGAPVSLRGDTVVALLHPLANSADGFRVVSVQTNVTQLPALSGQDALASTGAGGAWLSANLHAGDSLRITTQLSPDPQLVQTIGGGPIVIKDGAFYNDPYPPAPVETYMPNAVTAVSVTKDGTHVCFVVFDGQRSDPVKSVGLTHAQAAQYLLAHGAYQAILLDTGGSTEMVARLPNQHGVSVMNWPADGFERPVANGLFVYSVPVPPDPTYCSLLFQVLAEGNGCKSEITLDRVGVRCIVESQVLAEGNGCKSEITLDRVAVRCIVESEERRRGLC